MSDKQTFLILHGWGGNKPEHWQEHLAKALEAEGQTVIYPRMPDPMHPVPAAWQSTLETALASLPADAVQVTVLAHSLGAINWLHYAASGKATRLIADRVLLVAPPYVIAEIPPTDAPDGVGAFFPPPLSESGVKGLARETHLVATDSDDYATFEQTKAYSDRLNLPIHLLAGAGHISPYWGYGNWPWVLEWCLRRADLPPMPNK